MNKETYQNRKDTFHPVRLKNRQEKHMPPWDNLRKCESLQKRWGSYGNFLDKKKKRPVFAALTELIKKHKKPTVLEVGCGCGHWLWLIHQMGVSVIGQDYSKYMRRITIREFAKRNVAIKVRCGLCWDLPFDDDSVDISFQIDVCMHIGGSWKSIQEMLRVSRKAVFFTGPSFEEYGIKLDRRKASNSWGVNKILLEKKLAVLKQEGKIAKFYYRSRPSTSKYNHRILIIEKVKHGQS